MFTPYTLVMAARAALAVMVPLAILAALTAPPGNVFAESLGFLVACMLIAQLAIMALPWNRRNDLVRAVLLLAVTFAVLRTGFTGSAMLLGTIPAGLAGVGAVWLTLEIERCRGLARSFGDTSFAAIRIEVDRRHRQKREAAKRRSARAAETSGHRAEETMTS